MHGLRGLRCPGRVGDVPPGRRCCRNRKSAPCRAARSSEQVCLNLRRSHTASSENLVWKEGPSFREWGELGLDGGSRLQGLRIATTSSITGRKGGQVPA